MFISTDWINGISLGMEFVPENEEEDYDNTFIVDLLVIRLLFQWQ